MKIFRILLSISVGVLIVVGITYVVSLNKKVNRLDSLYSELNNKLSEVKEMTETISRQSSQESINQTDSIQYQSEQHYSGQHRIDEGAESMDKNPTPISLSTYHTRKIRNIILSELRKIDASKSSSQIASQARNIVKGSIHKLDDEKNAKVWFNKNILTEDDRVVAGYVRKIKNGWDPFQVKKEDPSER